MTTTISSNTTDDNNIGNSYKNDIKCVHPLRGGFNNQTYNNGNLVSCNVICRELNG